MAPHSIPAGELDTAPLPTTPTATGPWVRVAPAKAAVTVFGPSIVTVQVEPPPVHAPPQATAALPSAVSVTVTPLPYEATQEGAHAIPSMSLETRPPSALTTSAYAVSGGANVAVTDRGLLIVIVHGPVPEQSPLHPAKLQPGVGVAVRVTVLSVANDAEHVGPQSIPDGALDTVPLPFLLTATGNCDGRTATNVAVTPYDAPITTGSIVHEPPPEHAPPQPAKTEPEPATAERVTGW